MKKVKKISRITQVTEYTYESNKDYSTHEVNIRLTEQMHKVAKTEEHLTQIVADVKQIRLRLEIERAIQNGLQAVLDVRH